jgi:hypothetical protein
MEPWEKREIKLLNQLESTISYYIACSNVNRFFHRILGSISLVCAVFSPIFVVSATGKSTEVVLGMSAATTGTIALVLSIIVALVEGLRRMYRPEERWSTCWTTMENLKAAREEFFDRRIGYSRGSIEWLAAYGALRNALTRETGTETRRFFERIETTASQSEKSQNPNTG